VKTIYEAALMRTSSSVLPLKKISQELVGE